MSDEIAALKRRAFVLYDMGRYEDAVPLLREFAVAEPANPFGWFRLSYALSQLGSLREAGHAAERAIATDPQYEGGYRRLADALAELGRWEPSLAAARRATEQAPNWCWAWNVRAARASSAGYPEEAKEASDRALELAPEDPDIWLTHAQTRTDWSDAAESARQAILLAPENPWGPNALGWALWKLGRDDEAEDCFRRALSLAPGYRQPLFNLATVRSWNGHADEAARIRREAYERELLLVDERLDRTDSPGCVRSRRGQILHRVRRDEEAIADLRRAVAEDPANGSGWLNLGHVAGETGDLALATHAASRLREEFGDTPWALLSFAWVAMLSGRADDAETAAARLEMVSPAWRKTPEALAAAAVAAGRWNDAEEHFERALALEPRVCCMLSWLALVRRELGKHEAAERDLEASMRINAECLCDGAKARL